VVIIDRDPDKVGGFSRHVLTQEEVLEHIKNSDFELDRIETFLVQHNIYVIKMPNNVFVPKTNTADFAYFEERGLIVIPTFASNRILAYQYEGNRLY
jgi:hypothetical protein